MFCAKCGNELRPGVSFCQVCGAKARWERVAGNSGQGTPTQRNTGYGAPAQGTPAQGVPVQGASLQRNTGYGAPAQGTPRYGMPNSAAPTGMGPAQRPVTGAAAQAPSQAGADFAFRIAEGVVSCLSIICALTLPVAVLTVSIMGSVSMQFTAFDIIQAPTKYKELFGGMMGSSGSTSSLGGNPFVTSGPTAAASSPEAQGISSLSMAAMAFGVVLVIAVVCSVITAYYCFAKNSEKRYPTSWAMAGYAAILVVAFTAISTRLASEMAKAGGGFIDVSNAFSLDMGLGIWVPLIGGITCIVLDFMRASRANQSPGVSQPPIA